MNITLYPEQKGKRLGDLFGLFFEDLNHAADGGLYAELLQNRDFEFDPIDHPDYHALTAWHVLGDAKVEIDTQGAPFARNPHYARISAGAGGGLANEGYCRGIAAKAGQGYRCIIWARADAPVTLSIAFHGAHKTLALSDKWEKYERILTPKAVREKDVLAITAVEGGAFSLAYVSLMPLDTWKGRKNGMRRDIAQALADMKPRFLRFPGGCLTHDGQLDPDARDGIYNWKLTVGPVESRPARRNNWKYHQSMGLGFFEYFLFCEDIGCEPIPVLNGGVDPHHLRFAQGELLERYIQDALDLIDFAKGGVDTPWGSVRAQMGHPEPFTLNYLAIGNEEIHERFHAHMALFARAIRSKDPAIRIIGSAGPVVHGKPYQIGWEHAREQGLDYVDEHYYQAPSWFLANWDHYADYPAEGPKVFLGEYASWSNTMQSALAEAAYMTGLQNAPAVALACYAPMLCHVDYVNWSPDMLWFDGVSIVKTPNYHVQSMFMRHQGAEAIAMSVTDNELLEPVAAPIAGEIRFIADETPVELTDIVLTAGDRRICAQDCHLAADGALSLGEVSGDFCLTFTLRRTGGRKGILLRFGQKDEKNYHQWTIGGWQNSDSGIETRENGLSTCLTQSNLYLETDRVYHMALTVSGDEMIAQIDGQQINRIAKKPLRLKPLYLAASVDATTGDVILKAVNVRKEPVEACIAVPAACFSAEVLCAPPSAANSLSDPDVVTPALHPRQAYDPTKPYRFPGHSVTVLRFHRDGRAVTALSRIDAN